MAHQRQIFQENDLVFDQLLLGQTFAFRITEEHQRVIGKRFRKAGKQMVEESITPVEEFAACLCQLLQIARVESDGVQIALNILDEIVPDETSEVGFVHFGIDREAFGQMSKLSEVIHQHLFEKQQIRLQLFGLCDPLDAGGSRKSLDTDTVGDRYLVFNREIV